MICGLFYVSTLILKLKYKTSVSSRFSKDNFFSAVKKISHSSSIVSTIFEHSNAFWCWSLTLLWSLNFWHTMASLRQKQFSKLFELLWTKATQKNQRLNFLKKLRRNFSLPRNKRCLLKFLSLQNASKFAIFL